MNLIIKLLNIVALLENLSEQGVYRGQVGTIVDECDAELVEVGFSDLQGCTYALESLKKSQLMIVHHRPLAQTQWLKSQPSLQKPVLNR